MEMKVPLGLPVIIWSARAIVTDPPQRGLVKMSYCAWSDHRLDFLLAEEDLDQLLHDLTRAKAILAQRRERDLS